LTHEGEALLGGDEWEEELLKAGAFGEGQAVELNAHAVRVDGAHDGTVTDHGLRIGRQEQAHVNRRGSRKKARGLNEGAAEADVEGDTFYGVAVGAELDFGTKRDAAKAAALVFDGTLGGADKLQEASSIDRLIEEEFAPASKH
jgi:hypothetical protein